MNKKILCILQLAPPVHGASAANGYLVNSALINRHFKLDVINLRFNKSNLKLEKFSVLKIVKAVGYSFTILYKMFQFRPDLVYYTPSIKGFSFYRDAFYIFLIKLFRKKIVLHLHSKGPRPDFTANPVKKFLYTRIFKHTYCICLSQSLQPDIEKAARSVPYIVPNGIPIYGQGPFSKQKINAVPTILFLSNYIKSKGILILIEALRILKEEGYVFNLRLVGAPADITQEILEVLVRENNLSSSVEIVGPLYNESKMEEYKNADLFVHPSYNDAFPLVLLEAMQFGLPIVSTFEGGIPDMIMNNVNGILVETKNAEKLAGGISTLLKDSSLRYSMGNKGYELFKNKYTLEHFENNMHNTFTKILAES